MAQLKIKSQYKDIEMVGAGSSGRKTKLGYQKLGDMSQEQLIEWAEKLLANPKNAGLLARFENSLEEIKNTVQAAKNPKKVAKPKKEENDK